MNTMAINTAAHDWLESIRGGSTGATISSARGAYPPAQLGGEGANSSADRITTSHGETNRAYAQNIGDTARARKAAGGSQDFGETLMGALAGVDQPAQEERQIRHYESSKHMNKFRGEAGSVQDETLSIEELEKYYTADASRSYLCDDWTENTTLADDGGLSVDTAQGTKIQIQRASVEKDGQTSDIYLAGVTRANGVQFNFEFNENVRINDNDDGTLSVYYADTGETHLYDAKGARTVQPGEAGSFTGTGKDDILINLNSTSVDGGDGNDTIINFADNVELKGGAGNDTVLLAKNVSDNRIDMGNGDDRVLGLTAKDSEISMGDGNDTVGLQIARDTNINLGQGNNRITVGDSWGGSVTAEDGDNTLRIHDGNGIIMAGNGNNTITSDYFSGKIDMGGGDNKLEISSFNGNATLGDGDNEITVNSMGRRGDEDEDHQANNPVSRIEVGDGSNTVRIRSLTSADLDFGNGSNTIDIDIMRKDASVFAKNGDNTVNVRAMSSSATLTLGDGDNTFTSDSISMADVLIGNGNNTVNVRIMDVDYDTHGMTVGNGSNNLFFSDIREAELNIGNGDNKLFIDTVIGAEISLGNGDNSLSSIYFGGQASFGNGDNSLNSIGHNGDISFGNGNNTLNISWFNGQARLGNGDNRFNSDWFFGQANFGDGDNSLNTGNLAGQASFGNGDNTMLVGNFTSNGTLTAGNGKNEIGIRSAEGGNLVLGAGVNTVGILYGNLGIQGGPHTNAYYAQLADSGYQLSEGLVQAHDESTRRQDVADMMTKLRNLLERPYE